MRQEVERVVMRLLEQEPPSFDQLDTGEPDLKTAGGGTTHRRVTFGSVTIMPGVPWTVRILEPLEHYEVTISNTVDGVPEVIPLNSFEYMDLLQASMFAEESVEEPDPSQLDLGPEPFSRRIIFRGRVEKWLKKKAKKYAKKWDDPYTLARLAMGEFELTMPEIPTWLLNAARRARGEPFEAIAEEDEPPSFDQMDLGEPEPEPAHELVPSNLTVRQSILKFLVTANVPYSLGSLRPIFGPHTGRLLQSMDQQGYVYQNDQGQWGASANGVVHWDEISSESIESVIDGLLEQEPSFDQLDLGPEFDPDTSPIHQGWTNTAVTLADVRIPAGSAWVTRRHAHGGLRSVYGVSITPPGEAALYRDPQLITITQGAFDLLLSVSTLTERDDDAMPPLDHIDFGDEPEDEPQREFPLTAAAKHVLLYLAHQSSTVEQLMTGTGYSEMGVAGALTSLLDRGYVEEDEDIPLYHFTVTDSGREFLATYESTEEPDEPDPSQLDLGPELPASDRITQWGVTSRQVALGRHTVEQGVPWKSRRRDYGTMPGMGISYNVVFKLVAQRPYTLQLNQAAFDHLLQASDLTEQDISQMDTGEYPSVEGYLWVAGLVGDWTEERMKEEFPLLSYTEDGGPMPSFLYGLIRKDQLESFLRLAALRGGERDPAELVVDATVWADTMSPEDVDDWNRIMNRLRRQQKGVQEQEELPGIDQVDTGPEADVWTRAVEAHSGERVHTLEVVADPKVSGTYAIMAVLEPGEPPDHETYFYLYRGYEGGEVDPNELEEVEFMEWPPVSGELKFFEQTEPGFDQIDFGDEFEGHGKPRPELTHPLKRSIIRFLALHDYGTVDQLVDFEGIKSRGDVEDALSSLRGQGLVSVPQLGQRWYLTGEGRDYVYHWESIEERDKGPSTKDRVAEYMRSELGAVTLSTLSRRLEVSKGAAAGALSRLRKDGKVKKIKARRSPVPTAEGKPQRKFVTAYKWISLL